MPRRNRMRKRHERRKGKLVKRKHPSRTKRSNRKTPSLEVEARPDVETKKTEPTWVQGSQSFQKIQRDQGKVHRTVQVLVFQSKSVTMHFVTSGNKTNHKHLYLQTTGRSTNAIFLEISTET